MKTLLSALPLVLLAACATVPAPPAHEGPAALGQTTMVGGLAVTPERVVEDSRCPMNARCVWAGRVVLRAQVEGGAWRRSVDLTLGEPKHVADGALTLVSVTPEQVAGEEIDPASYRFAFEFDGGL